MRVADRHAWLAVFTAGLGLWVASIVALVITEEEVLLPSVVLLGSFLVPVTCVFWLIERNFDTDLTPARLAEAFFIAGVLGLLAAAALETWMLPTRLLPNLWVGLIEEAVKGLGIVLLARGLARHTVRDGVLLGATVGLGFGAFESAGYTLSFGFSNGTFSLADMVNEEIVRAIIAPFCHGIWSGLFGAALFAAHGRVNLRVIGTYLGVAALHALWDASSTAGIVVTVLATGTQEERDSLSAWILPSPANLEAQYLYGAVQWGVMIGVAALGVVLLRRRWRAAVRVP